jgi:hypothetical protein
MNYSRINELLIELCKETNSVIEKFDDRLILWSFSKIDIEKIRINSEQK